MEIEIIAIAPYNGWAFIKEADEISLIRPPYVFSNKVKASEKDVGIAIHSYGFEECDLTFNNMREVIQFLKDKYVDSLKSSGIYIPSSDQLKELLKYATDDILIRYLEKADKELIPKGRLDVASSIAFDIINLRRENIKVFDMAMDILKKCDEIKKKKSLIEEIKENQQETWEYRFPNTMKRYSPTLKINYSQSVYKRKRLLPIGM